MKKAIPVILLLSVMFVQCATTLTRGGSQVQTVTDAQRDCCCTFISVVATGEEYNPFPGERAMSAMNKARNEVARLGGNAMRIIDIESASDDEVMVIVEALICEPHSLNSSADADDINLSQLD